jgi:peroxiredoxin
LQGFQSAGVTPIAVSVDAPEQTEDLRKKAGYTFEILADPDARVVRKYDLLHPGGGPGGHDISKPAEFLIDRTGTIRWENLTDDFRVRARPEEMLAAARSLQ